MAEACGHLPALKELDFNLIGNRALLASRGAGRAVEILLAKCPALDMVNLRDTGMSEEDGELLHEDLHN